MITIDYCKEGRPVSDFETENFVKRIIEESKQSDVEIEVSTTNVITYICMLISQDKLSCYGVTIKENHVKKEVNKYGDVKDGIAEDMELNWLLKGIEAGIEKRNKEREEKRIKNEPEN